MRLSGMAVRDLQHYIALVDAGEQTVPDRLDMLREHRDTIRRQIRELTLSPPPPNTRSPRTAAMPENPDAKQHPPAAAVDDLWAERPVR